MMSCSCLNRYFSVTETYCIVLSFCTSVKAKNSTTYAQHLITVQWYSTSNSRLQAQVVSSYM
jgi:hypothetical protein